MLLLSYDRRGKFALVDSAGIARSKLTQSVHNYGLVNFIERFTEYVCTRCGLDTPRVCPLLLLIVW